MRTLFLFFLTFFVFLNDSFSAPTKKIFRGFEKGQSGFGFLLGQPLTLRYQRWTSWKTSLYFDGGYNLSDKTIIAATTYVFYFYDEKDTWRKKGKTNIFMFYAGPGLLAGFGLEEADSKNSTQLAARALGGVEYIWGLGHWSLRGEIGAAVFALGRTATQVQGGIGITYYFDSSNGSRNKQ